MGKRLRSYVHVHDQDGVPHVYGPEDDVPKAHAELIGDHAWVDDDEPLEDNRPGVVIDNAGQSKAPKRPASSGGGRAKAAPSRRSRSSAGGASAKAGAAAGGKADGAGDGGSPAGPDGSGGSGSGD